MKTHKNSWLIISLFMLITTHSYSDEIKIHSNKVPDKEKIGAFKKPQLHQFGAYINSYYVRFNVEIENDSVYGQVFNNQGESRYIYGNIYKDYLIIYDENNTGYTFIIE